MRMTSALSFASLCKTEASGGIAIIGLWRVNVTNVHACIG